MHHKRKRRHRRRAHQSFGRRARFIRRNAEPVHAGIDLQVDVDRTRKRGLLEHAHLLGRMDDDRQRMRRDVIELRRIEKAFEQQDRAPIAARAQLQCGIELDQRESVRRGERRQHAAHAVSIRIRLDDRQYFRAGGRRAYPCKIAGECAEIDVRHERAGHARGNGAGALSATARKEEAAGAKALGRRVRSWYKAPAAHVRIITIDSERQSRQKPRSGSKGSMKPGFYIIIAAQFFSSLADQALLVAAIALLRELHDPAWMTPALKQCFVVSYVVLAPVVGAFADSMPKGRVMLLTNAVKIVGCAMMLGEVHPLLSYAVVGLGAAAYSPAKYGILTELLPPQQLVIANSWIEGATVASIILGVLLGGLLITPRISAALLGFDLPMIDTPIDTPPQAA